MPGLSCQVLTEIVSTQYTKEETKSQWLPYSVHCVPRDREVGSVLGLQVEISRLRENANSEVRTEASPGLPSCLDLTRDSPCIPTTPSMLLPATSGVDYCIKRTKMSWVVCFLPLGCLSSILSLLGHSFPSRSGQLELGQTPSLQ